MLALFVRLFVEVDMAMTKRKATSLCYASVVKKLKKVFLLVSRSSRAFMARRTHATASREAAALREVRQSVAAGLFSP